MTNRQEILLKASSMIESQTYINNWFKADSFFNETYVSGLINNIYFITKDYFMPRDIYAVRKITTDGIDTISEPLDSLTEAETFLNNYRD